MNDEVRGILLTKAELDALPRIDIGFSDEELEEMRNEKLYAEQFDYNNDDQNLYE